MRLKNWERLYFIVTVIDDILKFNCVMFFLTLLFLQVRSILGQTPTLGGTCPVKTSAKEIDMRKLSGQWFEVEASPLLAEWMFKCISIKVAPFFQEKSQITIQASSDISDSNQLATILVMDAVLPQNTNGKDGKIELNIIPGSNNVTSYNVESYTRNIQILDTDYKSWVLVWSCHSYQNVDARAELIWILSRQRNLTPTQYEVVRNALVNFNLEHILTLSSVQIGCTKADEIYDEAT